MLRTTLAKYPDNVEAIISATVCIHNFIMKNEEHIAGFQLYCPAGYIDSYDENGDVIPGSWRDESTPRCITRLNRVGSNRAATNAMKQQDAIAAYFISNEGQIPWQWNVINKNRVINVP